MSYLKELTKSSISAELQKLRSEFRVSQATLIELVRSNYEDYVEMFYLLKAQGIGCYDYLVGYMDREHNIKTTVSALRATFYAVRVERGERVFKSTGEAFSNKKWDNTSRQGKSVTPALQPAPQKIERARYSREELGTPAAGRVGRSGGFVERSAQVIQPALGGPITWSIGSAEEKTPTTFAGVVLKGEVFLRDMAAVKPLMEEIAAQGSEEAVLACLAFLKAYCDKCGFRSSGEGVKLQPHNWLTFLPGLVKSLQNRLSTLEERKAL